MPSAAMIKPKPSPSPISALTIAALSRVELMLSIKLLSILILSSLKFLK